MTDVTQAIDAKIFNEPEMAQEAIHALPLDEKMALISSYRKKIQEGFSLSETAGRNAVRLLRSARAKAIQSNPHASKKAKEEAVQPLDLLSALKGLNP